MIDSNQFSNALTERFGLPVVVRTTQSVDGQHISIRPRGIERTIAFEVELKLGWRSITASFRPDNYASALLGSMQKATPDQKSAFGVFVDSLYAKGASLALEINGTEINPNEPDIWPSTWNTISIGMKKVGIILEKEGDYDFAEAFPWATGFFGLTLSLLPLEPVQDDMTGASEGAVHELLSKRYERSRINRAACIEINGTSCRICNFSFGGKYGPIGEGFIHVHHIVPLSEMGNSYILNPAADLIPVCPNCHAMLHRKAPVLLPGELIGLITSEKAS